MSVLDALAISYGAPPEELIAIRDELIAAKRRFEGPGANVWPVEVLALWAVREAARASGRAPRQLGPKPAPRPPIPVPSPRGI